MDKVTRQMHNLSLDKTSNLNLSKNKKSSYSPLTTSHMTKHGIMDQSIIDAMKQGRADFSMFQTWKEGTNFG